MRRTGANRRIVVIMALSGLLVLTGFLGWLGPVRWIYDHTLVPVVKVFAAAGSSTGDLASNLGRVSSLALDNQRLVRENADLRRRLAADAETNRDNELLRKQLGLEVAGTPGELAAEVVAFQPDSYRQFVTINKGSKAGLKDGMAAMSEGV